jgi:flagellar protein FlgJ
MPGNPSKSKKQHHHVPEKPSVAKIFIDAHLADAKAVSKATGVPVGVILAQSALESGWGQHVVENAYFGVKGRAPNGQSVVFATHENIGGTRIGINDSFRAYKGYRDAADDYANMLRNNTIYSKAFKYKDAKGFAGELHRYATDPAYVKKLQSIISKNKLSEFD